MSTFFSGIHWCQVLGAFFLCYSLVLLTKPALIARCMKAFPRSVWTGRVLSAIAWIWTGVALYQMNLDLLMPIIKYLPFIIVVCIGLSWVWMKELLASCALAGIFMLLPMPLILAVRADASLWRLVPVTIGYIMLTLGMDVMLYPWHHRNALTWASASESRLRMIAAIPLTLSILLFIASTRLSA